MIQYLALLRGINVGGKNLIKMSDLKKCFEDTGFTDVSTYIQSGNVIFKTGQEDKVKLAVRIEKELSARFSYVSKIVLLTHDQLDTIVREAPAGFGLSQDEFRYDVIFLRDELSPDKVMGNVKIKEGVDTAYAGSLTLYFSRLISKASQSRLSYLITLPIYQNMTIRNWNTTKGLLDVMNTKSGLGPP